MRPRSCKAKGRRLQQKLRDRVLRIYPILTPDDVRSNPMGNGGCDLMLSSQAKRLFPFSVECKNEQRIAIWEALAQAEANCEPDTFPLVVFSRNRSPMYAALPLDSLLVLIAAAKASAA